MNIDSVGRKLPSKKGPNGQSTPYDHGRYIRIRTLRSWDRIRRAFDELGDRCWAFRGQADARWQLRTSLVRALERGDYFHEEEHLISIFKSRAHHYLRSTPSAENDLEWLALMQHHGAPARLLDFTWSPYVALFFAIEQRPAHTHCAVWAVNASACQHRTEFIVASLREWHDFALPESFEEKLDFWLSTLSTRPELFRSIFLRNHCDFVCAVQPSRVNERMVTQQGVFLCPGKQMPLHTFEGNLLSQLTLTNPPDYLEPAWNPPQLYQLIIPTSLRTEPLQVLNRMNINRATLFPGLDGFCASLAGELTVRRAGMMRDTKFETS